MLVDEDCDVAELAEVAVAPAGEFVLDTWRGWKMFRDDESCARLWGDAATKTKKPARVTRRPNFRTLTPVCISLGGKEREGREEKEKCW